MRLNEITVSRKLRRGIEATHSAENIDVPLRQQLKKNGWEFINSGYFSQVYDKLGSPYVLKINTRTDTGFDSFAKFCQKMNSPYLPKIHDRKYFTKNDKTYYIYMIEKLSKCPNALADKIEEITTSIQFHGPLDAYKDFLAQYPGLEQLLITLVREQPDYITHDIGKSNIMFRMSDSMPVIIDPWAVL